MENLEEYFCSCLSVTGIPLVYVMRENTKVLPEADDPVGNYNLMQDELITHAPILTVANPNAYMAMYLTSHQHIWDKIKVITCGLDCWTYVHTAQHTTDGCLAYQNLNRLCLGVNNMSTLAEAKLASTTYDGEKHPCNFEKYVKIHIDQHVILAGLVEHGYSSIDERSKVCHLMNGIKTRDLDPLKTQILSNAMLHNDFDVCINLFKDYITQNSSLPRSPGYRLPKLVPRRKMKIILKLICPSKTDTIQRQSTPNSLVLSKLKREKHGHIPGCQGKK